jgi:phage terminase large subunit-like protein
MNREETKTAYKDLIIKAQAEGKVKEVIAELGRNDLFFFILWILKRADVDRDWLFDRCREVQRNPNGYLDLWAREHYKSTIISFALTLQDILNDPELTIGIFSLTRPMAKRLLRQIKVECENNKLLFDLFPDVMWQDPAKESPKWSEDDGLVFKRKSNPSESTVEAWGLVDAMPTGKHFKIRIYDDVIDERNVSSPEMINKAVNAWELSLNLGSEQPVKKYKDINIARHIGTRYHYNDPYSTILKREVAIPRVYPATHDGTMSGDPVLWTKSYLDEKRKILGPYIFGCQLLLNPVADEAEGFKLSWIQRYNRKEDSHDGMNLYILVDPAGEKKKDHSYTVILVVGLAEDKNYYLVDGIRDRINLTERAAKVFEFHRQYDIISVGYEKYSMQADIEHLQDKMEREKYRFPIVQLGGQTSKNDRIKKLIPIFETNRMWIPQFLYFISNDGKQHDLSDEFVNEEYLPFPVGYKDMLDCMARIVDPELNAQFPIGRNQTSFISRSHKKKVYEPFGSLKIIPKPERREYPNVIRG